MFGIINLFKPLGPTSRDCVNHVQRLLRPIKVGHAGTLDPMADGVLLVPVGQAVRLVDWLHELPKTYEAVLSSESRVCRVTIKWKQRLSTMRRSRLVKIGNGLSRTFSASFSKSHRFFPPSKSTESEPTTWLGKPRDRTGSPIGNDSSSRYWLV